MRGATLGSDERSLVVFHNETELRKASCEVRSPVKARRTAVDGKVCAMNFRKKLTKTHSGRSGCFGA